MRISTRHFGWLTLAFTVLVLTVAGCTKVGSTTNGSSGSPMYLSIIHGAPYTGTVSFYLNDTLLSQSTGITTGAYSKLYAQIKPGFYAAKFTKAASDSILGQLPASAYDTLNYYTLILYNTSPNGATRMLKIHDDFSGITAGNAYYRFFNLTPDYPQVNIYLNGAVALNNRTPADNAVDTTLSNFRAVGAGSYIITARDAATDSLIATSGNITMTSGNAFTVWLSGQKKPGSQMSINVLQAAY